MSKTPTQEKTQQDLHKYWNSTTSWIAIREKEQSTNSISSNRDSNILEQSISGNSNLPINANDKKRKAPVKEKTQEEISSSPLKRMYETVENKETMHRSSSSGNLQTNSNNIHPNPNVNRNPTWMVEMEQRLENNLTMNLTENLRSIIDESMNKAIEKVTASVNKMIETNLIAHSTAISEIKIDTMKAHNSINIMNKEQEELKAKLTSIENRALENCLVFRGLMEGEYEKESETHKKVKETLKNLISSNSAEEAETMANNFEIRRCKCLGKYFKDRSRPISVDFLQKDDTDFIMENKSQLPEGIYADREYSQETECRRKLLRPILKAARQNKDFQGRCKLEKDTLVL